MLPRYYQLNESIYYSIEFGRSVFTRENCEYFQFGVIYAGAQKNFGPAGITLVIVREDLLNYALPITPAILNFKENYAANSEYNTPPTFVYALFQSFFLLLNNFDISSIIE